jgi:hypothetical protein
LKEITVESVILESFNLEHAVISKENTLSRDKKIEIKLMKNFKEYTIVFLYTSFAKKLC